MAATTRLIGIGSPHGDDAVGWQLVDRLQGRAGVVAECLALGPGQLLDAVRDCGRAIVIDGCASGRTPGTITRLVWPDPRIAAAGPRSTHGLGVAELLQLAATLGWLPPQVVLFGVEVGDCRPGGTLSPAVAAALPELERQVLAELSTTDGQTGMVSGY